MKEESKKEYKNIYEKLTEMQEELKVKKDQKNTFGNYKYRSCEDILEKAKPLLKKYKLTQIITDETVLIGNRYYVEATVLLINQEKADEQIKVKAKAREAEEKKGMDASQVTGTASSYARKYALNGLYAIDDTKDADTDEYYKQTNYTNKANNTKNNTKKNIANERAIELLKIFMQSYKLEQNEAYKRVMELLNLKNLKPENLANISIEEFNNIKKEIQV